MLWRYTENKGKYRRHNYVIGNVFYSEKHSTVLAYSQWSPLRWTPRGKEVTECFAVASGSAAWPVACPSGFQTQRSPAGWECHKLRLWQPPTTETHKILMNRRYGVPRFFFPLLVLCDHTNTWTSTFSAWFLMAARCAAVIMKDQGSTPGLEKWLKKNSVVSLG